MALGTGCSEILTPVQTGQAGHIAALKSAVPPHHAPAAGVSPGDTAVVGKRSGFNVQNYTEE